MPTTTDRYGRHMIGTWKRITVGSTIRFLADFPTSHLQNMPHVADLDVAQFEYYEAGTWTVHLALLIFLKEAFRAGEVCIHDWFLKSIPAVCCLGKAGFDWLKLAKLVSDINTEEKTWRWALRQKPMNIKTALERNKCASYPNEHFAFAMIDVVCGYIFCANCLHGKLCLFCSP